MSSVKLSVSSTLAECVSKLYAFWDARFLIPIQKMWIQRHRHWCGSFTHWKFPWIIWTDNKWWPCPGMVLGGWVGGFSPPFHQINDFKKFLSFSRFSPKFFKIFSKFFMIFSKFFKIFSKFFKMFYPTDSFGKVGKVSNLARLSKGKLN